MPPEGFAPHFRRSPVTDPWEPIYSAVDPDRVRLGLTLTEAHCNGRGFVHGGVIAALADNAMGLSYVSILRARAAKDGRPETVSAVTVSLSVDYCASARTGQWFEVVPRVIRAGRAMGFVEAMLLADGEPAARASATFRSAEAPQAAE